MRLLPLRGPGNFGKLDKGPAAVSRLPLKRIALGFLGTLVSLQTATLVMLKVVDSQRKARKLPSGFPHLPPTKTSLGDNTLTIYSYGEDLFPAMLDAIEAAKESIYLETFMWKGDELGQRFKDALQRKAREGVAVYVIFDSFANLVVPPAFKRFPPEIHTLEYRAITRPWQVLDPLHYALDHRKLLVVDGDTGFVGGYNIGSLFEKEWRDTHLRIQGPVARELAQAFVNFWNREQPPEHSIPIQYEHGFDPTVSIWSNDAFQLSFPIRDLYLRAVHRAQHRILLTNAYFVPDHILLRALEDAVRRGVDVQILLPWDSNHILADWTARAYFTDCLRSGIRIFGYKGAMIHAKTCTIDGQWSTVGTANIDRLSSLGNFEVNVEVYSKDFAHKMEELFACDKTNSFELTLTQWLERPWYDRVSERILAPLRVMV